MFDEETIAGEVEPIRVVVIEDNTVARAGFRARCPAADPPIVVIQEYDNPQDFFDDGDMTPDDVDVVVLDLQYGVQSYPPDLRPLEILCEQGFKVVVLTKFENDLYLTQECLNRGARAYVAKDEAEGFLFTSIQMAHLNRGGLTPTMAVAILHDRMVDSRDRDMLLAFIQTADAAAAAKVMNMATEDFKKQLWRIGQQIIDSIQQDAVVPRISKDDP
ncbi:hypothetical protein [Nocardia amamiensis]|uniref:hypothetical protein n=1 Tax=Nocardia TaxID=1817 RepID=UPI0033C1C916